MKDPMKNPSFTSWLDSETEIIHKQFEEKRPEIDKDAFLAGFNGHSKDSTIAKNINNRYEEISSQEKAAISSFRDKAIKHETERLRLIEIDEERARKRARGMK
jgi:hypothetical protein